MVWFSVSSTETGDFVKIYSIICKENYKRVLEENAVTIGLRLIGENLVFAQDNDLKHTTRICKDYLCPQAEKNVLQTMFWLPHSPDLNLIELLRYELDKGIRGVYPTSKEHLWQLL